MFVVDLLLLALRAVIFPDPGMERVFIHPEVAGGLGNRLVRFDRQFHRTFLKFGRILFRRGLAHRTHLVGCVSSVSPCVRLSIAASAAIAIAKKRQLVPVSRETLDVLISEVAEKLPAPED